MTRTILFRGLRTDGGGWVEGDLMNLLSGRKFIASNLPVSHLEVIPSSVGQFTGLPDKNGVKIFEGDFDQNYNVVIWCEKRAGWALATYDIPTKEFIVCHCPSCEGDFDITEDLKDFEVCGNIHQQNTTK